MNVETNGWRQTSWIGCEIQQKLGLGQLKLELSLKRCSMVRFLRHVHMHNMENICGASTEERSCCFGKGCKTLSNYKNGQGGLLEDGRWIVRGAANFCYLAENFLSRVV
mmetsp:Transcript_54241/g.96441  ORF Transcript_54241/g.96441 Transcript_54241/m.96441 type:complete len:109 (-) Transcript_54241:4619-4945(-)